MPAYCISQLYEETGLLDPGVGRVLVGLHFLLKEHQPLSNHQPFELSRGVSTIDERQP